MMSGGLTKTELISIALEKLQRQRNICRYWLRNA